jgi:hypothetical protein
VLERFLALKDARSLCEIFPELTPATLSKEQEAVWVHHQLALRAWKNGGRAHTHFALETWFELFGDARQTGWLKDWGMPIRRFYDMTAHTPLACDPLHDMSYRIYAVLSTLLPPDAQLTVKRTLKQWMKRST